MGSALILELKLPDAPINLLAQGYSKSSIMLTWEPPYADGIYFIVFRLNATSNTYDSIGKVFTIEYFDTACLQKNIYSYKICAVNGMGRSVQTDAVQGGALISGITSINRGRQMCNVSASPDTVNLRDCMEFLNLIGQMVVGNVNGYVIRVSDKKVFKFNNGKFFSGSAAHIWVNPSIPAGVMNLSATPSDFPTAITYDVETGIADTTSIKNFFGTRKVKIIYSTVFDYISNDLPTEMPDNSLRSTYVRQFKLDAALSFERLGAEILLLGMPFRGGITGTGKFLCTGYAFGYFYDLSGSW